MAPSLDPGPQGCGLSPLLLVQTAQGLCVSVPADGTANTWQMLLVPALSVKYQPQGWLPQSQQPENCLPLSQQPPSYLPQNQQQQSYLQQTHQPHARTPQSHTAHTQFAHSQFAPTHTPHTQYPHTHTPRTHTPHTLTPNSFPLPPRADLSVTNIAPPSASGHAPGPHTATYIQPTHTHLSSCFPLPPPADLQVTNIAPLCAAGHAPGLHTAPATMVPATMAPPSMTLPRPTLVHPRSTPPASSGPSHAPLTYIAPSCTTPAALFGGGEGDVSRHASGRHMAAPPANAGPEEGADGGKGAGTHRVHPVYAGYALQQAAAQLQASELQLLLKLQEEGVGGSHGSEIGESLGHSPSVYPGYALQQAAPQLHSLGHSPSVYPAVGVPSDNQAVPAGAPWGEGEACYPDAAMAWGQGGDPDELREQEARLRSLIFDTDTAKHFLSSAAKNLQIMQSPAPPVPLPPDRQPHGPCLCHPGSITFEGPPGQQAR